MRIRTLIIDDEVNGADSLRLLIERYCPSIELIAVVNSPEEGIIAINDLNPQLVFLDIEMPNKSGFELLRNTRKADFKVIFTTAHQNYAIKAIKHGAVDYLLKPIDTDELLVAVEKVNKEILNGNHPTDQLQKQNYPNSSFNLCKIPVPTMDGFDLLDVNTICRLSAESNYTTIYQTNGKKTIVTKSLGEYEEQLIGYGFLRVHRSHIINPHYVEKYIRGDGGYLQFTDGSQVEIARRKKNEILEKLGYKS